MRGDQSEANVLVTLDGSQRTLAVKRVRYSDGSVITFDDITDQLSDQPRNSVVHGKKYPTVTAAPLAKALFEKLLNRDR